jgi:hypothetical protein
MKELHVPTKKQTKMPVQERTLLARINRHLAHDNERVHVTREGGRAATDLGRFYVIRYGRGGDEPSTNIIDHHVDIEEMGRELGLLRPYEVLAS